MTASVGSKFQSARINDLELVSRIFASWNQLAAWLRQLKSLQMAA